jgi:6,7-dimethyl-8-ribityllumazine synthase
MSAQPRTSSKSIVIVASRFNDFITKRLLDGCLKELKAQGIPQSRVTVIWVPGAFEIPVVALACAKKKTVGAVICLGAVIRGETFHFDIVALESARGVSQVALQTGKPIIYGILTTDTVKQASKRSESKGDNKGRDAAQAALDMMGLLERI